MGTVSKIHPRLIGAYNRAYAASREAALETYGSSSLPQLRQAREELAVNLATLAIRERAWHKGQQDTVDELIEKAVVGAAGAG